MPISTIPFSYSALAMQRITVRYGSWTRAGADPYGRAKQNQVSYLLVGVHVCDPQMHMKQIALIDSLMLDRGNPQDMATNCEKMQQ